MSEQIVYWTPGNYKLGDESWSFLYRAPERVSDNKFVFYAPIDDNFKLPMEEINRIQKGKVHRGFVDSDAMLAILQPKKSDKPDHAFIQYNMNWQFFTEGSLDAVTSLPDKDTPVEGATFEPETLDIGLWYTQFGLNYHIPLSSEVFDLKRGAPLFYVEFNTDKKVELVRYNQSVELHNLAQEYYALKPRYGRALTEQQLVEGIFAAEMPQQILSEIRKNIV